MTFAEIAVLWHEFGSRQTVPVQDEIQVSSPLVQIADGAVFVR
tara:strand:+ start:148807 stop:148935 length:129 start_codon:yes stop_codon:yes gene_type:complete